MNPILFCISMSRLKCSCMIYWCWVYLMTALELPRPTFVNPLLSTHPWFQNVISHTLRSRSEISRPSLSQAEFHIPFLSKSGTSRTPWPQRGAAGIAIGYGLDIQRVGVRIRIEPKFFSSQRRPDRFWGPLSLLANSYRVPLSHGVKRQRREAVYSPPVSTEVKNTWIYIHFPICLHGIVRNYLGTGTTLPFSYFGPRVKFHYSIVSEWNFTYPWISEWDFASHYASQEFVFVSFVAQK
jgi:hypothetical protein